MMQGSGLLIMAHRFFLLIQILGRSVDSGHLPKAKNPGQKHAKALNGNHWPEKALPAQ